MRCEEVKQTKLAHDKIQMVGQCEHGDGPTFSIKTVNAVNLLSGRNITNISRKYLHHNYLEPG